METAIVKSSAHNLMRSETPRDFVAVIFRRRRQIGLTFVTVFLGVILGSFLLPEQYEAEMKLLIKRERMDPVVSPANPQLNINNDVTIEDLNSEVELIKSRDLLEKVVVACGLDKVAGESLLRRMVDRLIPSTPDLRIANAVGRLGKKLTVEPIAKSKIITASFKAEDPKMAGRVLQTLSEIYLQKHVAVHSPVGVLDFFQKQVQEYQNALAVAEQKLTAFGENEHVVSLDLQKELILRKQSEFEGQLRDARAAEAAVSERIKALETLAANRPPRVTTQVHTANNPYLLQQMTSTLLNLELKRTELLTKFSPEFPLVKETETEIAQTREALIQAEKNGLRDESTDLDQTRLWLDGEIARARAELATYSARSAEISKSIALYRNNAQQINEKESEHNDLVRSARTAEENYLLYLRKGEEARITDALDRNRIISVAVVEPPAVPALRSFPIWTLNLTLGLIVAFLTSLGLAFIADYLDPSFHTPDEAEIFLGIPVIAAVPVSHEPLRFSCSAITDRSRM